MTLGHLLETADTSVEVLGSRTVVVSGLALDSRLVRRGDVFVARLGQHEDGHRFVAEAIRRGAAAIVATHAEPAWRAVPVVVTPDVPRCLALMAARFHGDPSRVLTAVGVTGTNGKTTVTYLIEAIWRAAGVPAGVIGTINYRHGSTVHPAPLTTPEAPDLQSELAGMLRDGVRAVAVEVSSHALALGRVEGCHWDAAVFTNLSHDHLDFHHDLESYYRAKARLFLELLPESGKRDPVAVINVDDPFGRRLARAFEGRQVTFGRDPGAAVHPGELERTLDGIRGTLSVAGDMVAVESALIGDPHVDNLMAAAAVAHGLGVPHAAIAEGFRACSVVPGRIERIAGEDGVTVLVDYAHTPDALERVLATLRPLCGRRLVSVFGCGGDRDRTKRPMMGEAAARLSDVVILTSDNPRREDPAAILGEIEAGVTRAGLTALAPEGLCDGRRGYAVETDRRRALALSLEIGRPGDIVVVAGKGHEDYQIVGTERRPFDDRAEIRALLRVRRGGGAL